MDRNTALIFAGILALGVIVMLIKGDAAAGEGISREDDPLAYWGIVAVASAGAIAMLVVAWQA